jgi:hypothetical protein
VCLGWLVNKRKIETDENEPSTSVLKRKKRQKSMIQST